MTKVMFYKVEGGMHENNILKSKWMENIILQNRGVANNRLHKGKRLNLNFSH